MSKDMKKVKEKLTWERLQEILPLLNARALERESGLGVRKIRNCLEGKSTMKEEDLERVRKVLSFF